MENNTSITSYDAYFDLFSLGLSLLLSSPKCSESDMKRFGNMIKEREQWLKDHESSMDSAVQEDCNRIRNELDYAFLVVDIVATDIELHNMLQSTK